MDAISETLQNQRLQIASAKLELLNLISVKSFFPLVIVSIIVAEITVKHLLLQLSQLPILVAALIDATAILTILSTVFYLTYYRPIQLYCSENLSDTIKNETHENDNPVMKETQDSSLLLSPRRLLPLMVISIFLAETVIMFLLTTLPSIPIPIEALIDASGLLIILSPTFYFLHYRPLQHHYHVRKRIMDKLYKSEERLQLALEAVNDSLWDCDLPTGNLYVSPRAEKMLGFDHGEIIPHASAWEELLHPDEKQRVLSEIQKHIAGHTSQYNTEHRLRTKNGDWIWVLARGQVVSRDAENRPLRMVGTHTDITQRKQAEESLRQSEVEIRTLSHKLIHASEEEKLRLAQDLHDEFGQVLTAFQLGVEMLRDHQYTDDDDFRFHCDRLLSLVTHLETDLRSVCDQLRPVMLDDVGLADTLRWHINEFGLLNQATITELQISGHQHLSKELDIVLYRICQEGLNNAVKHADARRVTINLKLDSTMISLTLSDDGKGFDKAALKQHNRTAWGLGLLGMHERAAAVGGRVNVDSEPGKGTTVRAEFPIRGKDD